MVWLLPIELSMSADAFIICMVLGGALLAGWVLVRFERLGPSSIIWAVCWWAASAALIVSIPALVHGVLVSGLPQTSLIVVFGVGLPIFTYFFLAGAWFMRTLMELFTGGLR
jgi:hypothetical protein